MIKERRPAAAKMSVESPPRYRRACITELGVCVTERGICRRTDDKVNWSEVQGLRFRG